MLTGLVAAGYYRCFYGRGRGAAGAGAGAAVLGLIGFLLVDIRFCVPLLTALWLIMAGYVWGIGDGDQLSGSGDRDIGSAGSRMRSASWKSRGEDGRGGTRVRNAPWKSRGEDGSGPARGQKRNVSAGEWEQLFLAGGVWLLAYSLAECCVGNVLLPIHSLQAALAAALSVMAGLYLLGRGKLYPLWAAALAMMWLLAGFLGRIAYGQNWQTQVMTVSLYAAAGGILVWQQIYCIWRKPEQAGWEGRQQEPVAGGQRLGKDAAAEWREAADREYRQLQIFEHDFRHHLDIVAALYEEGSAAEARNYIEDLKQARESRRGRETGGERELSYIMMAKRNACREAEITFSYQIIGSPRGIARMDMTALLLNLLDNAIRACAEVPKPRSIGVMLLSRGELCEIEMVNSGHYAPGKGQHSGTREATGQQAVWRERMEGQHSGTREATGQQAVWRERMEGQHSGTREATGQQAVWREYMEGQCSGTREVTEQQADWRERMEGQHSGRQLHGIGMVSVRQIVDKYQGTLRIWEEEGRVRQKLILVQRSGQEDGVVQGETE